jgi:hypothetical protein
MLLLWVGFAYVSWTVYASRYGTPPFLAVTPLAALVAMWLAEILDTQQAHWLSAVVVALLIGLLVRDYGIYPESSLRGLADDSITVPAIVDPSGAWAALFGLVLVVTSLLLVSPPGVSKPMSLRISSWVRSQWESGPIARAWLLVAAATLAICLSFGFLCWAVDLPLPSLHVRVGRVFFFVPFVLAVAAVGLPWLRYGYSRLGERRVLPVLIAAVGITIYATASLQPRLSRHFSPKSVYDAYEELSRPEEPLVSFRSSPTSARYYTKTPVTEIDQRAPLIAFLVGGSQRWAVLPTDDLVRVDSDYRRRTGRHLYVADASSARLVLVAAQPLEGRPNQSFLARHVVSEVDEIQHRLDARFDDRVELLGYDLTLPDDTSVGAGQRFAITWYWNVLAKVPRGYQPFVHIDGYGQRINGDHTPVEGKYPTRYWQEGDVIIDRHELAVPANFPTGDYTIYVGLFKGDDRLEVQSGPNDGSGRVRAGVLSVR